MVQTDEFLQYGCGHIEALADELFGGQLIEADAHLKGGYLTVHYYYTLAVIILSLK
jgi:hypothetical protein